MWRLGRASLHRAGDSYRGQRWYPAQEIDDAPRAAILWQKIAVLAEETESWSEATHAYDEALANLDPSTSRETRRALLQARASALTQVGSQARAQGDFLVAEQAYRAALQGTEQGSN